MNFFTKYKKIISAIVITIILFFAYSFFFAGDSNGDGLISSSKTKRTAADIVGAEIIQALNQIERLQLDRAIFSDPVYKSLVDRSQPIPPEPVGKDNPFGPIGASGTVGGVLEIIEEEGSETISDTQ